MFPPGKHRQQQTLHLFRFDHHVVPILEQILELLRPKVVLKQVVQRVLGLGVHLLETNDKKVGQVRVRLGGRFQAEQFVQRDVVGEFCAHVPCHDVDSEKVREKSSDWLGWYLVVGLVIRFYGIFKVLIRF